MEQVHAGLASNGMAWFAKEQTAGKGQRGKTWESEPGSNIALSLVLQPHHLNSTHQFYLSATVALACLEFFSKYAGRETKIKWPNDLYWRDRKAGGILIENVFTGSEWKYAVVGIGININQTKFSPDLKNPVSLKQITGNSLDTLVLAKELYELVMKKVADLQPGSFENILRSYNRHLYAANKKVKLKKDNAVFETEVKGVNVNGQLITTDTMERQFDFGDVEWLLASG